MCTRIRLLVALAVAGLSASVSPAMGQTADWERTNGPFGGTVITAFLIHPEGDLFAGTEGGLFRSTDDGHSWSQVDTGFASRDVSSIALDVAGELYAGTASGLYRSDSKASSWSAVMLPGEAITAIRGTLTGMLYAGTAAGRLFRSPDQGVTWTPAETGLPGYAVNVLASTSTGTILAGTQAGIYRSANDGETWVSVNGGLSSFQVNTIVHGAGDRFFAGTQEGDLYLSTNGGGSWSRVLHTNQRIRDLAVRAGGEVLAGTVEGLIRLTSNGQPLQNSIRIGFVIVETIDVGADGSLYAGTFGGGVYRSGDGGATWQTRNEGLGSLVTALAFTAEGTLYAGTFGGGIFRTTDRGQTWQQVNEGLESLGIVSVVVGRGALFAAAQGGLVFRSTDGTTWTDTFFPGLAIRGLFVNARGDVFAGATTGLYRLNEGSAQWSPPILPFDIKAVAIAPDGQMYASLPARLLRSPDDGITWGAAGLMEDVQALAINPAGDVYAAVVDSGAYRSFDIGEPALQWSPIDAGLPVKDVRTWAILSTEHVLAGTYGGGVFYSGNSGDTWTATNDGLDNLNVRSFAISPDDGAVFAGTSSGVYRGIDPVLTSAAPPVTLPRHVTLSQNYPNPFNPTTSIRFDLPYTAYVQLAVFDVLGRKVTTLVDGTLPAGPHTVAFEATGLPTGTYLYRLEMAGHALARTMVLLH